MPTSLHSSRHAQRYQRGKSHVRAKAAFHRVDRIDADGTNIFRTTRNNREYLQSHGRDQLSRRLTHRQKLKIVPKDRVPKDSSIGPQHWRVQVLKTNRRTWVRTQLNIPYGTPSVHIPYLEHSSAHYRYLYY